MQPEHQYHNPIGTEMFHQPKMTPYTFCNCKYMAKLLFHSPKCSPHTATFHKQNLMFTTHAIYSPSKKRVLYVHNTLYSSCFKSNTLCMQAHIRSYTCYNSILICKHFDTLPLMTFYSVKCHRNSCILLHQF